MTTTRARQHDANAPSERARARRTLRCVFVTSEACVHARVLCAECGHPMPPRTTTTKRTSLIAACTAAARCRSTRGRRSSDTDVGIAAASAAGGGGAVPTTAAAMRGEVSVEDDRTLMCQLLS
jgi:hypothetical protein